MSSVVPINTVMCGDSPRLAGEDPTHVECLAQATTELPPIVVHRPTMRVVDGRHRLRAAQARGDREIAVRFVEGTAEEAFVLAVRANLANGLPLTTADRLGAARRIITFYPQWSDRKVGAVTGLAGTTVAALRRRVDAQPIEARVGQDGRVRPLDSGDRRRLAGELITRRPEASLREIARAAGIAPSTVLDVRDRLRRGEDPVPQQVRGRAKPPGDRESVMAVLRQDPTLRFKDSGRGLLRWLEAGTVGAEEWQKHVDAVPPHCVRLIAEVARTASRSWQEFVECLEVFEREGTAVEQSVRRA
jgi:ParB-like chromosome segregation protein Spo0J